MLSNELSTIIGGRYKEIYIQSLSYNEFLQFHHLSDNDEALALYIHVLQVTGADDRQRGGLHPSERPDAPPGSHGKRLRGVDTDDPVGFAAGFGRDSR